MRHYQGEQQVSSICKDIFSSFPKFCSKRKNFDLKHWKLLLCGQHLKDCWILDLIWFWLQFGWSNIYVPDSLHLWHRLSSVVKELSVIPGFSLFSENARWLNFRETVNIFWSAIQRKSMVYAACAITSPFLISSQKWFPNSNGLSPNENGCSWYYWFVRECLFFMQLINWK